MSDMSDKTVFVVLDNGDMHDGVTTTRGVFDDRDEAESKRRKVNGPFKDVSVVRDVLRQ